jgi:hypothetical protein
VNNFRVFSYLAIMALVAIGCKEDPAPLSSSGNSTGASTDKSEVEDSTTPLKKPAEVCTWETPLVEGIPGSPGNPIPSKVNPNGDSELASMMRQMMADMEVVRRDAMNGSFPTSLPTSHAKLRCAWPTEASMRSETYDAMAVGYVDAFEKLATGTGDARARYGAVITACLNCHATACPGPTVAIEKLRLDP